MGSYPALYVNPPRDQTQGIEQGLNLRNLLQMRPLQIQALQQEATQRSQNIQLQTQQLKDQQAITQAWKSWDGKSPDSLIKSVIDNGGSGAAANQIDQQMMARQSQHAQLDEATFNLQQKKTDRMLGRFSAAEGVSDDQLSDHVKAAIDESLDAGDINPREAQAGYQLLNQSNGNPKMLRDGIDAFRKGHMLDSQLASRSKEAAETQKAQAEAQSKQQEFAYYQRTGLGAPGVPAETVQMASALQQNPGMTPGQYPAYKAGQTARAEAPVRIATAQAEGVARANVEAQFARGSNAAVANVPPHLVAPASADAAKAGQEYAQAKSVTDRLQAMMDAARKGNVVSYQLIPQEGALQVTTSQGVHRINMAEIQNYGGGSLWQRLQGHIGKQLTGKSIPDSVLNDMADMQEIQAKGSRSKYENSLKTINQTYGASFKPVDMSDINSASPQQTTGGVVDFTSFMNSRNK